MQCTPEAVSPCRSLSQSSMNVVKADDAVCVVFMLWKQQDLFYGSSQGNVCSFLIDSLFIVYTECFELYKYCKNRYIWQ